MRGNLDDLRGCGRQAGHLQLVDLGGKVGGADVHLLRDIFSDDVDDELAGSADVARCVLGDEATGGTVHYAHPDDRRVGAEIVVGAEGRGVEAAIFVHAGDQSDGSGCNQANQELVGLARCCFFKVVLHGSLFLQQPIRMSRGMRKKPGGGSLKKAGRFQKDQRKKG